ncbi:uncharacterized protein LOC134694631 [Mytilus trossulus]|uniref:uncharacterized protein LOC134694631 n=1 Tax=Mytilus trossulus TaxID=6551 RepID=UPI003006EEEA
MIFAYGSIYVKVSKESKANLGYSRRRTFVVSRQEFQLKLTIEQELAVTITSIIGFFLICYTPFTFVLLLRVLIKDVEIDPIVMAIPSMITKIAGIFTPFVFLRKNKVFREHMMKIYPCLRSRKKVHAAESIEQTAVTNVHNNDKTTIVNRPEANEGNNFKQCDNRKCSPIKKKTTTNEGNNSEGCDNRKCSLIRQETTTNDITERTKKVQDNCSNIAVYTVDKSDIYEYQKESSFSRNVGKCSVGIIDTLDAENVMNLSGV